MNEEENVGELEAIDAEDFLGEDPLLTKKVVGETPLQELIVYWVGSKLQPENNEVTVEMIVEVFAQEFPDFLLAVAQENFIRGYQQAIDDIENFGREDAATDSDDQSRQD